MERRRGTSTLLWSGVPLAGAAFGQVSAALAATLLPLLGPVGVVALRQFVAAVVLVPNLVGRRRPRALGVLRPALLLGAALLLMNITIYAAIERIGLGLAVTLEFLGPLAVALIASRRAIDLACGVAAGGGVVLLTGEVAALDPLGIGYALLAGAGWAAYIVLSDRVGRDLPGLQGTAFASVVAAACTLPFLVAELIRLPPDALPMVLLIGAVVGIFSSALPYSLDLLALRRIPRRLFSVLQSVHPAAAAVAGLLILGQRLSGLEILGLAIISVANVVAVLGTARPARPPLQDGD